MSAEGFSRGYFAIREPVYDRRINRADARPPKWTLVTLEESWARARARPRAVTLALVSFIWRTRFAERGEGMLDKPRYLLPPPKGANRRISFLHDRVWGWRKNCFAASRWFMGGAMRATWRTMHVPRPVSGKWLECFVMLGYLVDFARISGTFMEHLMRAIWEWRGGIRGIYIGRWVSWGVFSHHTFCLPRCSFSHRFLTRSRSISLSPSQNKSEPEMVGIVPSFWGVDQIERAVSVEIHTSE